MACALGASGNRKQLNPSRVIQILTDMGLLMNQIEPESLGYFAEADKSDFLKLVEELTRGLDRVKQQVEEGKGSDTTHPSESDSDIVRRNADKSRQRSKSRPLKATSTMFDFLEQDMDTHSEMLPKLEIKNPEAGVTGQEGRKDDVVAAGNQDGINLRADHGRGSKLADSGIGSAHLSCIVDEEDRNFILTDEDPPQGISELHSPMDRRPSPPCEYPPLRTATEGNEDTSQGTGEK